MWEEGRNLTYTSWYKDAPANWNIFSWGGADCAIAVNKEHFLSVTKEQLAKFHKDVLGGEMEDEEDDWRKVLEEQEDIKWLDVSCQANQILGYPPQPSMSDEIN